MSVLDAFGSGLLEALSFPTFWFLLIGVAVGFAVGILPGLGGGVTLALMLPFTYGMEPTQAFAFLLGMLAVTATTGDVTSILFGVPGEATSAALVLDGHALAKKGKAGLALGAALTSSLVGAIVGAFVFALSIPIVRPLVLAFASPEFFMLTIVGVTFVSVLSSDAMVKGLAVGGIGLLLALVGTDPQSGTYRFAFGQLFLWDGIGLVPVALGLFAFPELVDLARGGSSIAGGVRTIGGVVDGIKVTFQRFWLTLRCSFIGTFIGMIPGLGGSVAQWIAYGHAAQSSKHPDRFGSGEIDGVLGPGAANNSKEGGSLIPMVAFGIPGSLGTAILLGAFLIHGISPGPSMLTTNLTLTMSFVWVIVVSNIIAVTLTFLVLRPLVRLTTIRGSLLIPPIIALVLAGAFAEQSVIADMILTVIFGFIGIAMVELKWPRVPMILGLVLGGYAETNLFRSTSRYGLDWVTRPIVLGLLALAVLVVAGPFAKRQIGRLVSKNQPSGSFGS